MRLKLTEKLLWDLYNFKNKTEDVISKIVPEKHGLPFSNFNLFRDEWTNEGKKRYEREKNRKRFSQIIKNLKNKGYLNVKDIENRKAVMITPRGMKQLFEIELKVGEKNKRPDKKWQMILFDIPEVSRRSRDLFRKQLKYLGYQNLQKSIWVCPYDVLKATQELIKNYKLDRFVRLLLVEEIKI
jgi:predicted transcriptional regulator